MTLPGLSSISCTALLSTPSLQLYSSVAMLALVDMIIMFIDVRYTEELRS